MANLQDIAASAFVNLLSVLAFLLGFAFLRLQPVNDRVYFPKWYKKGTRGSPKSSGNLVKKFVNLDIRTYLKFWIWMPEALKMPESELIDHAGLDSVAYIRIYLLGLKVFAPIAILAFAVLVPINCTGETLEDIKDLTYSNIDKLSISNVPSGSLRLLAHILMAYIVTFWTCYVLYKEYEIISNKRLQFVASETRRPEQFTVLVRNIPPHPDESIGEHVEHFFSVNHPDQYLTHQIVYNAKKLDKLVKEMKKLKNGLTYYETRFEKNPKKRPSKKTGLWGLFGKSVDAIDYYKAEIQSVAKEEAEEREKIVKDPKAIVPAAFVSFKSRYGAAICAQTQQSRNPTIWLTEWAPEPHDVFWNNLAIPYVKITVNKLVMAIAMFFLTFFSMIPIAFVQSLASIDGIQLVLPLLKPLIKKKFAKSVVQGVLPGIALKLFTASLPTILTAMSIVEGDTSLSALERRTAGKYHLFILVNIFFGSIITGTAFQQLYKFLHQAPSEIPKTVGVAIPMKATFFITYIMVDGWSSIAAEIIRFVPLILFHLKNTFLVKTEDDKEHAMAPGSLNFSTTEPRIQLYFLLGLVYSVINVYDQNYESGATFWPDVHRRVIIGLIMSQVLLMGLLSTMSAAKSTPLLLVLPIFTIGFHRFCKGRFEPAFAKFPLEEAMMKDALDKETEPKVKLKEYLQNAYVHPVFKDAEFDRPVALNDEENDPLVSTKRSKSSRRSSRGSFDGFGFDFVDVVDELISYFPSTKPLD